ncbi:MAG: sulfatase [Deltaproteobacteria bacterium]|nr:sulfatase [Deltaproteobacteria bacterium]
MRRPFVPFLFLSVAVAAVLAAACSRPSTPPDILLVTIDTLRADHCSAYGYPIETTPVLAALAAAGTRYSTAYAVSATTAPSHASLMAGSSFRTLGVFKNGQRLPPQAVTVAEVLSASGYATAAFVSSFPVRSRFGFAQGFEFFEDKFTIQNSSVGRRSAPVAHDRFAGSTFAKLQAWLGQRRDTRPLFVWVHFVDPHFPYRAPEKFAARWPAGVAPDVRKYDAEVHYADKQLGRVIEAFDKHAGGGGALVIVTSDHGEGLGDHGWLSHGINLYEEAVRVPLVMRWSGRVDAGKVVTEPVSLIDVAPTILEAARVTQAPPSFEGLSLLGKLDPDRAIFMQRRAYQGKELQDTDVRGEMTALVRGGAKYILAPEENRREFYQLPSDPHEAHNLLAPPAPARDVAAQHGDAQHGDAQPPAQSPAVAAARRHDEELAAWREAHPESAGDDAPLDKEDVRALRSLGYVD